MALNDEAQPISTEDQVFFDAIRAEFGDKCTEDFCVRLARAFRTHKKNRMATTMAEAKRILDWRGALEVDSILSRDMEQSKAFYECWPAVMYGEDSEGHLVTVDRVADIQIETFQKLFTHIDTMLPHRVQVMERIQWEKAAVSTRLERRVYKHISIVDLKGIGFKHLSKSVITYLKVSGCMQGQ